jgi:Ca2+-binding RTX toxin-like protein
MPLDRAPRIVAVLVVGLAASAGLVASETAAGAAPPSCRGWTATIAGTDGADELIGSPRADVIVGRGGNDEIIGGRGDDLICAGGGADLIRGGRGNDDILGGPDDDRVGYEGSGRGVTVRLEAGRATGQGRDRLIDVEGVQGSRFRDTIRGTAGDNLVYAKGGNDVVYGGRGPDFLVGGSGADRLVDLRGSNTLLAYTGADAIVATPHQGDWLDGGPGRDRIRFRTPDGVTLDLASGRVSSPARSHAWAFEVVIGTRGGDSFSGSDRAEHLIGGGGNDYLSGGDGRDQVGGGSGFDVCSAERERNCEL